MNAIEIKQALKYLELNQAAFDMWAWDDLLKQNLEQASLLTQIEELETRAMVTLILPSTSQEYKVFHQRFRHYFGQEWAAKHIVHLLLARVLSGWNSRDEFIDCCKIFIASKNGSQASVILPVQAPLATPAPATP